MSNLGTAIASGIAQGSTGYIQGAEAGENRAQARQEAGLRNQMLEGQIQAQQYQQAQQKTPEQIAADQENLRLQTENIQHQQAQLHSFNSFKKYNIDSNPRHINTMMASNPVLKKMFPNFVQANSINVMDEGDMSLVAQVGIDPEAVREDAAATELYASGDTEMIEAMGYDPDEKPYQRFFKATVADGEGGYKTQIMDMQNIQEMMGYSDFLDDQEIDRQLKRATISATTAKARKDMGIGGGKSETEFSYSKEQYEKDTAGMENPPSYQTWKAAQKPAEQRAAAESKESKALKEKEYTFKDSLSTTLNEEDFFTAKGKAAETRRNKIYQEAKEIQKDAKPSNISDLTAKKTMIPAMTELLDDAQTLNWDKNLGTKIAVSAQKVLSEFNKQDITKMSREELGDAVDKQMKAMEDAIGTDKAGASKYRTHLVIMAKFKTLMAQYVKDMSGAAVTEAERDMYMDIMSGGNWGTKEAMIDSMSGFISGLETQYKSAINGLQMTHPRSYFEHTRDLHRMSAKYGKVKKTIPGRTSPSQVGGSTKAVAPTTKPQSMSVADKKTFIGQMKEKYPDGNITDPDDIAKYKAMKGQ